MHRTPLSLRPRGPAGPPPGTSSAAPRATPASTRNRLCASAYDAARSLCTYASTARPAATTTRSAGAHGDHAADARAGTLRSVAIARVGADGRRRRVVRIDLVAARGHHVPTAAEVVDPLSPGLPRGLVTGEVVERVAVVGHLTGAVGPHARGDRRILHGARHPGQRAGIEQRRPHLRAGSCAGRL